MVGELAERIGFPQPHCSQISLAVDEALSNVIKHGYGRRDDGRIWITIHHENHPRPAIQLIVEDHARQVDPETIRSRDLDDIRPGGLGVHIIRQVMDDVRFEKRPEGGMRLTMTKRLMPIEAAQGASAACSGAATHE
jgi:anti-sigma regulatory factor (Ser/Thr protein kinase)